MFNISFINNIQEKLAFNKNILWINQITIFFIGHLNVRSIMSKFDALVNIVHEDNFDIFAVTETRLNTKI